MAGPRRHLLQLRQDVAVARRDDQRLARAAQHRVHLDEVVDGLRRVLGQAHAHHEVDVRQLLAQRRHTLDVGAADPAPLPGVRVADVEDVRAGAAVRVRGIEDHRLGVTAARLDRPVTRRALESRFDELGRDAHARPVDLRAGAGEDLDGRRVVHVDARLGEHLERRLVHAPAGVVVPDGQACSVHGASSSLSWGWTRGNSRVGAALAPGSRWTPERSRTVGSGGPRLYHRRPPDPCPSSVPGSTTTAAASHSAQRLDENARVRGSG